MRGARMKSTISTVVVFVFLSVPAVFGKTKSAESTPTVTPTVSPTPEAKLKWLPPPYVDNDSKSINATVAAHVPSNSNGAYSLFDFSAVRKLDENDVSAQGTVRFLKSFSSSDEAVSLELREANVSLSEPWIEARVGRMDLSDIVSTTHFFGRYPLMGERRLDGIKIYIPFKFFFGVEDYKSVSSPPTSLSFFYFPTLLSAQDAVIDGSQGLFLGQARMKLDFGDLRTVLLFNLGASSSDFFNYGSLSGNPTYSICGEANFSKDYTLYFEYGVEDSAHSGDTNAFTFGARVEHLFTWEFLSLDQVTFEAQIPLANNLDNPFTGGNGINPALAMSPQMEWYGRARVRIRSIFIDFNITNSVNDFTFARLNSSNVNTPLPLPVGKGNETDGLEIPLSASSYNNMAFSIDTGVSF
jgi:hypothetical protein